MNFLNNLGANSISKLDNYIPFVHFTTNEFTDLKILNESNKDVDPTGLSKATKIDLIKYSFIIGDYSKADVYLKQLLIESNRQRLMGYLNFSKIEPRKHIIMFKSYNKAEIINLISRLYWHDSGITFNRKLSMSDILDVFYNHIKNVANIDNYKIWVILTISTYLDYLKCKGADEQNSKYFVEHKYDYLIRKIVEFFEDMMHRGLFYLLDCYGIFTSFSQYFTWASFGKLMKNKICYNSFKDCIMFAQKHIIDGSKNKTNVPKIDRNIYSFYELVESWAKILLLRLTLISVRMEQSGLIVFCSGINFSMTNPNKIKNRENMEMYCFIVEFLRDRLVSGHYQFSFFKRQLSETILKLLSKFKETYLPFFEISNILTNDYNKLNKYYSKIYQEKTSSDAITIDVIDTLTTSVIKFINDFYNLLVTDQQYRPQGFGYLKAKKDYENRIVATNHDQKS